jgi:hypothetical protein
MSLTNEDIQRLKAALGIKTNFQDALKEYGIVTEKTLDVRMVKLEKKLTGKMNQDKKELLTAIANVAVNSPTLKMHNELEKKVDKLLQQ